MSAAVTGGGADCSEVGTDAMGGAAMGGDATACGADGTEYWTACTGGWGTDSCWKGSC
jgi:hypothetical protein